MKRSYAREPVAVATASGPPRASVSSAHCSAVLESIHTCAHTGSQQAVPGAPRCCRQARVGSLARGAGGARGRGSGVERTGEFGMEKASPSWAVRVCNGPAGRCERRGGSADHGGRCWCGGGHLARREGGEGVGRAVLPVDAAVLLAGAGDRLRFGRAAGAGSLRSLGRAAASRVDLGESARGERGAGQAGAACSP